jgi:uroporphyrinogen-III synthase
VSEGSGRAAHALVLRPEPGNTRTVAALRDAGVVAMGIPLFAVRPLAWQVPDERFDALLLTSANAVRMAGAALARVAHLPVVAVGAATAHAARAAGLDVAVTGHDDVAAAVAAARAYPRLLHLAGREHVALPGVACVVVYASDPLPVASDALMAALPAVVLLHSARAAARFASLAADLPRDRIMLAALSAKVAAAAGSGWQRVVVADAPRDARLVALAAMLAIDPARGREDNARHD